jgi:hypothetical protein
MPGPIRELSPSVTLILPEDADACRANSMELTRRSLPMPYSRRMENWSRYKSALLAPPDTIGYDARRGAEWAS